MRHVFFAWLIFGVLFSEEENSISNFNGCASGIVGGHVNVVSGDFVDSAIDIKIDGPDPLVLSRSYASSRYFFLKEDYGWSFNHPSEILAYEKPNPGHHTAETFIFFGPSGDTTEFIHNKKGILVLKTYRGMTNCSAGILSGQFNLKNTKISIEKKSSSYQTSNGDIYRFGKEMKNSLTYPTSKRYDIVSLEKASGAVLKYDLQPLCNSSTFKKIEQFNADGTSQGWMLAELVRNNDLRKFWVSAGNGTWASYKYHKHGQIKNGYKHYLHLLTEVLTSHSPKLKYFYDLSMQRPKINIVQKGDAGPYIKIEYQWDEKVKALKAPVGAAGEEVVLYKFSYHNPYFCVVDNAKGHRVDYSSDTEYRLTSVKHYKEGAPYAEEFYTWGYNFGNQAGDLVEKKLIGQNGQTIYRTTFDYDSSYNVSKETLFGNLTGKSDNESYAIYRENSKGRFNNTLRVAEEEGAEAVFTYHENSNRLYGNFVKNKGKIVKRTFNHYCPNTRALNKVIVDDGESDNESDLSGATFRKITYLKIRQAIPVGLPEQIEIKYLDLNRQEEKLISRIERTYSKMGDVLTETHFDANNDFRFTLSWEYNSHRLCTKHVNAIGQTFIKKYDEVDRLIFEEGPRHDVHREYEYDLAGRLTVKKEVHDDGAIFSTVCKYDAMGNKIQETDSFGNTADFTYDELNRLTSKIEPSNERGERASTTFEYNELGQPIKMTDPRGYVTLTDYNIRGKPTRILHPDGTEELFEYSLKGNLVKSTAVSGKKTCFEYDNLDQIVSKKEYSREGALLSEESKIYKGTQLLKSINPEGLETVYSYDAQGRLVQEKTLDRFKQLEYNAQGFIASVTDGACIRRFQYDVIGRVIEERGEDLEGNLQFLNRFSYDEMGNKSHVFSYSQGEGDLFTEYNSRNLPVRIIDQLGYESRILYDYDAVNSIGQRILQKTLIDPKGNQTLSLQDYAGRVVAIEKRDAFNRTIARQEIIYDVNGNKSKLIDYVLANGENQKCLVHLMTYSPTNQLLSLIEANGTPEQKITTHRYNSLGQKVETIKNDGISLFTTYNEQGLIQSYSSSDQSFSYEYTYNKLLKPIEIKDKILHSSNILSYNLFGELVHETLNNGLSLEYSYNSQGKLSQLTLPDQTTVEYRYEGDYLKTVTRGAFTHRYDTFNLAGQCTQVTLPSSQIVTASYDKIGRIIDLDGPSLKDTNFVFDPVGNLISHTLQGVDKNFAYDSLYQLTSERLHSYTSDSLNNRLSKDGILYELNSLNQIVRQGDTNYEYDLNGNLTKKITPSSITIYRYDALNRLISITQNDETYTFTYDSFNRRLTKNNQKFFYQGLNEIGSYLDEELIELRILGAGKGAELGAAVLLEIDHETLIPLHDHNGNVIALLNSSGLLTASYTYSAFGEAEFATAHPNPWRYASKRLDSETNLIYFGQRYYDPSIGRWITPDPTGFADGPNLYAYLHQNPLLTADYYGLADASQDKSSFWDSLRSGWNTLCDYASRSLSAIGNCLRDGASKASQYASDKFRQGMGYAERAAYEIIPRVPVIKDVVVGGLHYLGHGNLKEYTRCYDEPEDGMYYCNAYGKDLETSELTIIYFNGMYTTFKEFHDELHALALANPEALIAGYYISTHGFSTDLLKCVPDFFRVNTKSTKQAYEGLKFFCELAGSKGVIGLISHSRGTLMVNSIGCRLKENFPNYAEKISSLQLACPCAGSSTMFSEVQVHMSSRDVVCCLGGVMYVASLLGLTPHVTIHKSTNYPFIDHFYNNEIYTNSKIDFIEDIRKKAGLK